MSCNHLNTGFCELRTVLSYMRRAPLSLMTDSVVARGGGGWEAGIQDQKNSSAHMGLEPGTTFIQMEPWRPREAARLGAAELHMQTGLWVWRGCAWGAPEAGS